MEYDMRLVARVHGDNDVRIGLEYVQSIRGLPEWNGEMISKADDLARKLLIPKEGERLQAQARGTVTGEVTRCYRVPSRSDSDWTEVP